MLGSTPSNGRLTLLTLPARQKLNSISVSPEPWSRTRLKSSGKSL